MSDEPLEYTITEVRYVIDEMLDTKNFTSCEAIEYFIMNGYVANDRWLRQLKYKYLMFGKEAEWKKLMSRYMDSISEKIDIIETTG
jgi:hypothetical protein